MKWLQRPICWFRGHTGQRDAGAHVEARVCSGTSAPFDLAPGETRVVHIELVPKVHPAVLYTVTCSRCGARVRTDLVLLTIPQQE